MENLAKAILNVMKAVKGIDKSLNVGSGNNSYKGVADKDVKNIIGSAMQENGLVILPIEIEPKTTISRWEEDTNWGKKQKQSVFTEVKTKYLLLHESGESQVLSGFGQGVDSQDKGAGKATTYALKYTLLYSFLTPTGKIDDADNTHSDNVEVPNTQSQKDRKPALTLEQFESSKKGTLSQIDTVLQKYRMSQEQRNELVLIKGKLTKQTA